jgi:hypothetical protein
MIAGAPLPAGFGAVRVGVAARAFLRKRAGEVARTWPGKIFASWASEADPGLLAVTARSPA